MLKLKREKKSGAKRETPVTGELSTGKGPTIVFLDFDGVLNSQRSCIDEKAWRDAGKPARAKSLCHWLPPYHIEPLNRIIRETGAKVVISSTWRLLYTLEELRETLKQFGFVGEVIDRTVDGSSVAPGFSLTIYQSIPRGSEISEWVTAHKPASFVILDDDADMQGYTPRLVQTNFTEGLTESHADRAIDLLRTPIGLGTKRGPMTAPCNKNQSASSVPLLQEQREKIKNLGVPGGVR